jgi:hypothetical protein
MRPAGAHAYFRTQEVMAESRTTGFAACGTQPLANTKFTYLLTTCLYVPLSYMAHANPSLLFVLCLHLLSFGFRKSFFISYTHQVWAFPRILSSALL